MQPELEGAPLEQAAAEGGGMIGRIAVGVDGFPEGRDAAALAQAISLATGADVTLVGVHPAPLFPSPHVSWTTLRSEAERVLLEVRRDYVPRAITRAETDWSVARALERVMRTEREDLLVMGSSRKAAAGHVRIGKRTRQLLSELDRALAVAPRGLNAESDFRIRRVGAGYIDEPEARAALSLAGWIAVVGGAELRVCAVVDDRVPVLARAALDGLADTEWHDVIAEQEGRLRERALVAARATGAPVQVDVVTGRPADALGALSREVDLLVIGSRRWGPASRVLLGSTGEELMENAACAILAVPRPSNPS